MSQKWLENLPPEIKFIHTQEYYDISIEEKIQIVKELETKVSELEHVIQSIDSIIKENYAKKEAEIEDKNKDVESKASKANELLTSAHQKNTDADVRVIELEKKEEAINSFLKNEQLRYAQLLSTVEPIKLEMRKRIDDYLNLYNEFIKELELAKQEKNNSRLYGDALIKRISEHQTSIDSLVEIRIKFEELLKNNQETIIRGTIIKLRPHEREIEDNIKKYLFGSNDLFLSKIEKGDIK